MDEQNNYLTWFKNLEICLNPATECIQLMSSSVSEPKELLQQDILSLCSDPKPSYLGISLPWGSPVLIDSISRRYGVSEQNILLTNGASNAIYLVGAALLKARDHVIAEFPIYQPLAAVPELHQAEITFVRRHPEDYRIDIEAIESNIKPSTRLIILTNLHNPSGAIISNEELKLLGSVAQKHKNLHILIDEIYHDFVRETQESATHFSEVFISISSLSKVYGLSLLRCGWIQAHPTIIKRIRTVYTFVENIGSRLLEAVSAQVFKRMDLYLQRSRAIVETNRQDLLQAMNPLIERGIIQGKLPQTGCIYYPALSGFHNPAAAIDELKHKNNIFVVPGRFFGDTDHIRIGFGSEPSVFKTNISIFSSVLMELYETQNR